LSRHAPRTSSLQTFAYNFNLRPYTTGCNLLILKMSFTVLVLDWTDVMVQLAIEIGDFTFQGALEVRRCKLTL